MNNLERNTQAKYLVHFLDNSWLLNLYILKSKPTEIISEKTYNSLIDLYLKQLESYCLSEEFKYLKIGFAFLHFGRRGVGLSIWHIGEWNCTYEIFCNNWYCYGRDIANMELLENSEPKICHYEIKIANNELENILLIISKIKSKDEFKSQFINLYH